MNIALIAHDAKKELMVQFCIAYLRHPQPPQSVCNRHHRQAGLGGHRPQDYLLYGRQPGRRSADLLPHLLQ